MHAELHRQAVLVTGGARFIGSNFVLDWLAQTGGTVVNLDKLTYAGNLENLTMTVATRSTATRSNASLDGGPARISRPVCARRSSSTSKTRSGSRMCAAATTSAGSS